MTDVLNELNALSGKETTAGAVASAVPQFTKVRDYTTFFAEYALIEENIVVHFFLPADFRGPRSFWKETFPRALQNMAPEYFQATAPRLVASYTEEVKSWWLRAKNFGHIIDIDDFMRGFFAELDNELDFLLQNRGE